ncbi:MAG TPA: hypothetical protein VM737_05810 [Gemmatimonadota bacterium]|nr:hypothetical protein [Gemmatimonadota bacterium]
MMFSVGGMGIAEKAPGATGPGRTLLILVAFLMFLASFVAFFRSRWFRLPNKWWALILFFGGIVLASVAESPEGRARRDDEAWWREQQDDMRERHQSAEDEDRRQRERDSDAEEGETAEVWTYCTEAVKDRLVSPRSADFPWGFSDKVVQTGKRWKASSEFDAENRFGASIRHRFDCILEYEGNGTYRLVSIDIQER